ncbi:zinc finger BED domain-containing protein 4-like [Anoplophora glabripennis]|uniref:zinc finger BED domain-containing protein 4-like n=1 Tax=Anoplophora glabripennis TaxID=217634 RepID=UPI000C760D92|nr:zinc finger BED domain-containing protein 4-like [Anoplophora glabripennis]
MLERFVQLEDTVKSTVALIEKDLPHLSALDWQVAKDLCRVLKPLENATKTISGDQYITGSMVIPLTNGVYSVYMNLKNKNNIQESAMKVVISIIKGLDDRLGNLERSKTFAVSTYLDPRFKAYAFKDEICAETAKKIVTAAVAHHVSLKAKPTGDQVEKVPNTEDSRVDEDDELSIWSSLEKSTATVKPKGTATSRALMEVQRYMEEDLLPRNDNPLDWWREHKYSYPYLSIVAQEKLSIVATSVPCERIFSKAGLVISDRRNRLSGNKVDKILFLNMNT